MFVPRIIETYGKDTQSTEPISYQFSHNRVIMLFEEITADTAMSVISQLSFLSEKGDSDIYMLINSPGGSVTDGMAIYDFIKHGVKCDVVTVCTGMAASMGAILLAAGTPGKRYAGPAAEVMIHQPLGGVQGQATDISIVADHIQKTKRNLAGLLADACGKNVDTLLQDMERDRWLTAEQAMEYGLVDHVGYPAWV